MLRSDNMGKKRKKHVVHCPYLNCKKKFLIPNNPTIAETRAFFMHCEKHRRKGYGAEFGQDTRGT